MHKFQLSALHVLNFGHGFFLANTLSLLIVHFSLVIRFSFNTIYEDGKSVGLLNTNIILLFASVTTCYISEFNEHF